MIGMQNVAFDKANNTSVEPTIIKDGLAIYCIGQDDPILLMPYPHGFTTTSMAEGALTSLLVSLDRKVITFDPLGAYRSTRPAQVDLPEMLACAEETLNACQVSGSVDVIGHSMGSLCALAFAIEHPKLVQRLILIGSMSGFPAIRRWGMPNNWCWWKDPEYWRFAWTCEKPIKTRVEVRGKRLVPVTFEK